MPTSPRAMRPLGSPSVRVARRPAPRIIARPGGAGRLSTRDRRQQLIQTGMRVFAKHGFRGATTRQLAQAAGVTEAVIFKHFADKEALYAAILEHKSSDADAGRWFAELDRLREQGNEEGLLRALYQRIVHQHERDMYFFRLMSYSALEQHPLARRMWNSQGGRLYALLEQFVTDGQRAGRFRAGSPAVLVRAILALPVYHVVVRRLFRTGWPVAKSGDVIETGIQFVLAGLQRRTAPAPFQTPKASRSVLA